jgi:type IV pilus assembly protein PilB
MLIKKVRLGDLLIQEHKITQQDLENAIKLQKTSPKYFNKRIGEILVKEGLVNEEIIMEVLSKQLNLPIAHKVEPDILLSKKYHQNF